MRATLPSISPLRVSITAGCPMEMSFTCVSAIFSSAFRWVGWATLPSAVPASTFCPSSTGASGGGSACSMPSNPARTFNSSTCLFFNSYWPRSCSTFTRCESSCACSASALIESRFCSIWYRPSSCCAFTSEILASRLASRASLASAESRSACSRAVL